MDKMTDIESRLRDELLVVRCQLGESQAFETLIRAWHGPLLRHVRRVSDNEAAEDIVQEVWLRVLRAITGLRDGAKLRPWLFGVAHHVMMDRLRHRYAERHVLDDIIGEQDADEPDTTEARFVLMETELAGLPLMERETLTLFYLEELSLLHIAEIQGAPVGTVKSRLFRARAMLRQSMLKGTDDV